MKFRKPYDKIEYLRVFDMYRIFRVFTYRLNFTLA